MTELSEFNIILLYFLILSELSGGFINEIENLNNVICEEMLHHSSDDKKFVEIWGRLLKIFKDIYELMNNGDSQGYVLAEHLFKTQPSCLKSSVDVKKLSERYNLSYERTNFLYNVVKATHLAYSLVELKYNMTDLENFKKSLHYPGNNFTDSAMLQPGVDNFQNPKLNEEDEEIKQRNSCVPDFTAC